MVKTKISNIINLKSYIHEKILPDKKIKLALSSIYPDAMDIEWAFKNNFYEATFVQEGVYKVACFDDAGEVKEEKIAQSELQLPDKIRHALYDKYQMNLLVSATIIKKQQKEIIEIIFDSSDKSRYLLQFDEHGQLLKEQLLFAIKKGLLSTYENKSSIKHNQIK